MFGPTLALLVRSLRVNSRLLRMHLIQFGFLAFMLFALASIEDSSLMLGAPGLDFFYLIAFMNIGLITLAGVGYFATSVTEEKDQLMLGLLKLAGISRLGLLLGLSTTRLISAGLVLIIQFPFTLLAITLGGVTIEQVIAAYVALLAYLVFVANLGMFCSVVCRTSGRAIGMCAVLLLAFFVGPTLLAKLLNAGGLSTFVGSKAMGRTVLPWISNLQIYTRMETVLSTGFQGSAISYHLVSNLGLALLLFVASWSTFEFFTGDQSLSTGIGNRVQRSSERRKHDRPWKDAIAWKEFHFGVGGRLWIMLRFIAYGVLFLFLLLLIMSERSILTLFWLGTSHRSRDVCGAMLVSIGLGGIVLELTISACRLFQSELTAKTCASLILLPMTPEQLLRSKAFGALLGVLPAAIVLLLGMLVSPLAFFAATDNFPLSARAWFVIAEFLLFLHLIVLFSLRFRWGALPLAFLIVFVGQSCLLSPVMCILPRRGTASNVETGIFIFLSVCVAYLMVLVQIKIVDWLERAAEE